MPRVTELKVSDVMEEEIVRVDPELTIDKVAKEMRKLKKVCAIVIEDKKPIGVVTESDIIRKVVSKDKKPSEVKVSSVMSSPLYTVKPNERVVDVSQVMMEKSVRQLPVIKNDKLVGIIYSRNIANVCPDIIEILEDRLEVLESRNMPEYREDTMSGYCEGCGKWSEDLLERRGRMLCRECRK